MMDNLPPEIDQVARPRAARIAYTLNNAQPVRCTYISEEPLFYLDQAVTDADDALDFDDDLIIDFTDAAFPDDSLMSTDQDAARLFTEQFSDEALPATDLKAACDVLRQSRMGAALLEFAEANNIHILTDDQIPMASYDRMTGRLILRPQLDPLTTQMVLVRELRRVWQHRQGALIHPLLFHPDHAIVINRVLNADLMTMVVRVAWELKLAGQADMWTHLEQTSHYDLTRAMKREALADFRALNNGRAAASVFEAWFLSERCRPHDRKLIQQMLSDYQGYVFKAGHVETSKMLTQQVISALGAMPYGKNYLTPHAATILADPIFTDIRDRSSANFLWFIKFEQSFRQTERDLQGESGQSTPLTAQHDTLAEIIPYPSRLARVHDERAQINGNGSATIIEYPGHNFHQP